MNQLLRHPPDASRQGVYVAASILSADFARMGDQCKAVLDAGADLLHLDVMDGHFVPNLTMGPAMCRSLRNMFPEVCLDVHLMVSDPAKFVKPFADAGATNFTFHIEAVPQPLQLIETIRKAGMSVGVAINPPSDIGALLPYVEALDLVLIMSVNPGFSGQAFIPDVLEKARQIKPMLKPEQRLEVDGGVGPATAQACRDAGIDVLVAASAIFGKPGYPKAVSDIRGVSQPEKVISGPTSPHRTFRG